jgi:hypothetical protein
MVVGYIQVRAEIFQGSLIKQHAMKIWRWGEYVYSKKIKK